MEKNAIESRCLYLVATPIGNLADISARAVKVLGGVDLIAAEDTRRTAKLLAHLGISKRMVSYHEHNKRERGREILTGLLSGGSAALVTDAGTPAISDPGEDLVALCAGNGVKVVSIPGPCAAVCALAASGLTTGRFTFEGFLSVKPSRRRGHLDSLKQEPRTMIFYEAPHKLRATLRDMLKVFGERRITLVREMTKINEEIIRTTLPDAAALYEDVNPVGEFTLVVEGAAPEAAAETAFWSGMTPAEHVGCYAERGLERMESIKAAARDRGISKSDMYKMLTGEIKSGG